MCYLAFTDAEGAAVVRSRLPAPLNRLQAWQPLRRGAGESAVDGDGTTHRYELRRDRGVRGELRGISAHPVLVPEGAGGLFVPVSMLERASRLVDHLDGGGLVNVYPEGPSGPAGGKWTCKLWPEGACGLTLASPRTMDYTLALELKHVLPQAMPYPYARAAA